MIDNNVIENDNRYIMNTYGRLPIVPVSGKGAVMIDINEKKYIDFTSGIGVNAFGYSDPIWIDSVKKQLDKIQHVSNYFYSMPTTELAEKLVSLTGLEKVFFCNSGAEANEGAIKVARKYSFDKYGRNRSTIVTFGNSFHGRTVTTLSATGQDVFHNYFFPFTDGFKYVDFNDVNMLKEALTDDVCAVMFEPIQGEGGVNIINKEFAINLRKLTEEKDILLIADEVQTGIGRTGTFLATEQLDISPDIVSLAKGLGGGLPIGAFMCGEKCSSVLVPGTHGSTFGGNPVVCAGALEIVNRVADKSFLDEVIKKGQYIKEKISKLDLPSVVNVRGNGLMIGIETTADPKHILKEAANNGLLVLTAGKNVIRLLPPLSISYDEIDAGLEILIKVIAGE